MRVLVVARLVRRRLFDRLVRPGDDDPRVVVIAPHHRPRLRGGLFGGPESVLLGRSSGELSRHHAGDSVTAHAYAVQRVGGIHRALLVRDDDELRAVRVALYELEEAVDVDVVERGLDLVEDVERTRPGEEDGEHEGQRDERLLAPGEEREALRGLAGRGDLDLDAGLGLLVLLTLGLGRLTLRRRFTSHNRARADLLLDEPQLATAAGEQVLHDVLEVLRGGLESLFERLADPAVGLLNEALELGERRLEVAA